LVEENGAWKEKLALIWQGRTVKLIWENSARELTSSARKFFMKFKLATCL